ncbi:amidase [Violaceomyces palustris]|uniref:Amidase n=1 Tax=Violaceomyces palustris TaxID=1673888 RepID=A0ACD0P3G6_9BASI|nr:amidase [Violaceomyces palustris]
MPSITVQAAGSPKIDGERLNSTLHHSCQWGATPDGGMNRVALNDDDAKVRRWLIQEVEKLGCTVKIDEMGNIFGIREGKNPNLAPIGIGSHLDTQATGGRYDGILGVLTGLEILRACHDANYKANAPLAVVCWTNEEGCRFAPYAIGSACWAHTYTTEFGQACTDADGITIGAELERHGMKGEHKCSHEALPLSAHFEVHIEQGPILDYAETPSPVAAVTGVQGLRWYDIVLQGVGAHAGTTPMELRKDAVIASAKMILEIEKIAVDFKGKATSGKIGSNGQPQAYNCILNQVELGLDLRHEDEETLEKMSQEVVRACQEIAKKSGVQIVKWDEKMRSEAMDFDKVAVEHIKGACLRSGFKRFDIVSGAGHDSVYTAMHCPTAMLFVRCKDGLSHTPVEYSSPEDIEVGAKVLLDAVLSYDKKVNGRPETP